MWIQLLHQAWRTQEASDYLMDHLDYSVWANPHQCGCPFPLSQILRFTGRDMITSIRQSMEHAGLWQEAFHFLAQAL